MRLNAAFLVGFIFLLSACAPLQPEPGMNFKDFNSKSALNMRGYLIPAGMYKDVGVSRYETRQQKLQRERGEAQPATGWVFYYEKDGVMISETELLALQSQRQKELQVAQSKARQTVNNRSISQTNQRNIVQSSNVQTPEFSSSNANRSTFAATREEIIECFGRILAHTQFDGGLSVGNRKLISENKRLYDQTVDIVMKVNNCRGNDSSPRKHKLCAESLSASELSTYDNYNDGINKYLAVKRKYNNAIAQGSILIWCTR